MGYSPCLSCQKLNRISEASSRLGQKPVCGLCKRLLPILENVNELSHPELILLLRKSPLPVVVDFWAPWCGPCVQFAPTFRAAATQFQNDFVFVKMNTEAHPAASTVYRIRSIPTLVLFQNGAERARQSGALPGAELAQWLRAKIQSPVGHPRAS